MIGSSTEHTADQAILGRIPETGVDPSSGRNGRTRQGSMVRDATSGTTSGEPFAPGLLTSGSRATGRDSRESTGAKQARRHKEVLPKVRHAVRALYATCLDCLERAESQSDNFFARNAALEQLRESLSQLWEMRQLHEEQFAEVINTLQCLFADRRVEDFQDNHLEAMRSVFERLRIEFEIDDQLANDLTRILLQGELDVFRELE